MKTSRYLCALAALTLVVTELHEQAHITVGRLVCGCYGERDFSVWQTGEPCAAPSLAVLATVAGPAFSYAVMALGAWLLRADARRWLGLALVFAALPFARIFTALMGGGDEGVVLRRFLSGSLAPAPLRVLAVGVVAAFCVPPLVVAYRALKGRRRWIPFVGLLLGPMLFSWVWNHKMMNGLLASGVLSDTAILGTPTLVLLNTALAAVVLAALWPRSPRPEAQSSSACASR